MATTWLTLSATPGKPYSFAAKSPAALPTKGAGQFTQLHPNALQGQRYSFLAKSSAIPVATLDLVKHRYIYDRRYPRDSVPSVGTPVSDFAYDAVTAPPTVEFWFTGVGGVSFLYSFGDDEMGSSTERDPFYTYQQAAGTTEEYLVCLTINNNPALTTCKLVSVTVPEDALSLYTLTRDQLYNLTLDQLHNLLLGM